MLLSPHLIYSLTILEGSGENYADHFTTISVEFSGECGGLSSRTLKVVGDVNVKLQGLQPDLSASVLLEHSEDVNPFGRYEREKIALFDAVGTVSFIQNVK